MLFVHRPLGDMRSMRLGETVGGFQEGSHRGEVSGWDGGDSCFRCAYWISRSLAGSYIRNVSTSRRSRFL